MSQMSELDATLEEIRRCGEALVKLSTVLKETFSAQHAEEPTEEAVLQYEVPAVTLEQVRGKLAEKAAAGHRVEVQALIRKYGSDRLSAVKPEDYARILAEAEAL